MNTNATEVKNGTRTRRAPAKAAASSESKVNAARSIFNRMHAKSAPRKDVVAEFQKEVGLTPSGASTYYQKFLSESNGKARPKKSTAASGRGRPIDEGSKAGIARNIFKKMASRPRKEILQALQDQAKLTPSGASTYLQKMRHAA